MQAISASATCLTHNYVLYVVAMHTEGVIYSRQHYSLTSLILRVVYCQFCKARLAHRHDTQSEKSGDDLHLTFDPWITVRITIDNIYLRKVYIIYGITTMNY